MKNWKIPLMVVTFVAFMQTYEAESTVLAEERRPPERWQVKTLFLFEIVKNDMQKYWCKLCKCKPFGIWGHEAFDININVLIWGFLAEWTGAFFLNFFPCQNESGEAGWSKQMVNLMKRAKALRFYGLMGKRSGMEKLICDKENMN